MDEEWQSLYNAREPTLQAPLDREKRVWVLLVRIDGLVTGGSRSELEACRSCSMRIKYGDTGTCEQTTIGHGQSRVMSNSIRCELGDDIDGMLEAPEATLSGTFKTTCVFTWRRNFAPILRFKVRKRWGIIERTIAKNSLDIPFCEERPGGSWLVRPGQIQQELVLLNKLGGGSFGHANISVEMQDLPRSELSRAITLSSQIHQPAGSKGEEQNDHSLALSATTPSAKGAAESVDAHLSNASQHESGIKLGSCFGAREATTCGGTTLVESKCPKSRAQAWTLAM